MKNTKDKIQKNKVEETAISVEGVSKTFKIPHEKHSSLKSAALNVFKKKTYTKFEALKDISFEVKKGEFFGIIGRNGSGKSTLLKILAGIYVPNSGKIKITGKFSPFLELGVGFNPELTARENVYLGGSILGLSRKEIDEKFNDIVKFAELEEFIDMKFKNFSSGMQVRLAFALSIFAHADILLMDEVLAVGDANFQNKCLDEFRRYRDEGKTVVLVSHDVFTIQKYCNRALLLRNGKVVKIGRAHKVGDEYIKQNIGDEEASSQIQEKKELVQDSKIRKVAKIKDLGFFDIDGKEKKVFITGSTIVVKITYEFLKRVKNPILGIIIRNESGQNVYALNTLYKKINTSTIRNGIKTVEFVIENQFATGTYTVSPAVATEDRKNLDWQDNMKSFRVINEAFNSKAIADFKTTINIK